jgi:hypothetical protein
LLLSFNVRSCTPVIDDWRLNAGTSPTNAINWLLVRDEAKRAAYKERERE